jgi:hypothetical protein
VISVQWMPMGAPEGEQRNQSVNNVGKASNDKRLQASYYEGDYYSKGTRSLLNTQTRLIERDGQFIFTYNEELQSNIPAYRMQAEGLVATTLVMDAFERADYRNMATSWEVQNSPICVFANRYQPVLDEGSEVLSYMRVEWISGVAHMQLFTIEGNLSSDQTIAEKPLQEDIIGNELVAAIATLGGSLLVRSLARAAITSSSRFIGTAIAETAIDAARGVTVPALKLALLALRGIRARVLVQMFNARGLKVVVNIGGTAARHELAQGPQIAVNPLLQGIKRTIPNLIKTEGENIGSLFGKKTVDKIISVRLPTSVNTGLIARGAAEVLKDGGQLQMHFFTTEAEFMEKFAEQLIKAGFKSAKPQLAPPFPGAKPVLNGIIDAIR